MTHTRIFIACILCLVIAACDVQKQPAAVKKTTEIKTAPDASIIKNTDAQKKSAVIKARPALNLSIDDIPLGYHGSNDSKFNTDEEAAESDNTLFEKLNKEQVEPKFNLSGKLLTDDIKLEQKQYLDSVDGVQINIEGNFN